MHGGFVMHSAINPGLLSQRPAKWEIKNKCIVNALSKRETRVMLASLMLASAQPRSLGMHWTRQRSQGAVRGH
jgi:hypothetical protein